MSLENSFCSYQEQVLSNAKIMADTFSTRSYDVVSGGTDNHLILLDLTKHKITGKAAEEALGHANITVNKNSVPNDKESPFVTSGIRIGTPAITTRGFKQAEAKIVADWICNILDSECDKRIIDEVKQNVLRLCNDYPVYSTKNKKIQVAMSG